MYKPLSLLCAAFLGASAGTIYAAAPPQKIDVTNLPAQVVQDVIVPVPSEVFNVLDRLGSPNWHGVLRPTDVKTPGERPEIALLMGAVIAEGFIAVEAQDAEEVKKIGRDVLKLAQAIGVRQHVVKRTDSIIEGADKKDWQRVKQEFDGALYDVRGAMADLNDEDLAQLVSLGGWLRGTEAVTEVVGSNYSSERAELLHQPVLLDYFKDQIGGMPPRLRDNPVVAKIHKRLPELSPLIEMVDGSITEASVKEVRGITGDLVKTLTSKNL